MDREFAVVMFVALLISLPTIFVIAVVFLTELVF